MTQHPRKPGRPKAEPTAVIRVPMALLGEIRKLIEKYKLSKM